MPVAIVIDSTAGITRHEAAAFGVVIVPLHVIVGEDILTEGAADGAGPGLVAAALSALRPVTTSRPTPAAFGAAYAEAVAGGATEIVSIHLSSRISGTFESAEIAAREATVPVHVVDSRQVGIATGFAVRRAIELRDTGASAAQIAHSARTRAVATTSLFYVDTLEYLRRGGRIGAAAAVVGGALSVKPLLRIRDGEVSSLEKVRTSAKALARLADLAVAAAGANPVDVGVAHLANHVAADRLVADLTRRLAVALAGREVWCGEVSAALAAHVGPGMVAVCVAPRL
ncbi:MAG: DegV family protein [Nocardioides sp.]